MPRFKISVPLSCPEAVSIPGLAIDFIALVKYDLRYNLEVLPRRCFPLVICLPSGAVLDDLEIA